MRARVAGMLPPGSPATMTTRTLLSDRATPSLLFGDLGQPQRVGRRAAEDRRLDGIDQARDAAGSTSPPAGTECAPS